MCYNAVDRHVENGRGDQAAVIYDSPVTGTKEVIIYREMQEQVKNKEGAVTLVKSHRQKGSIVNICQ